MVEELNRFPCGREQVRCRRSPGSEPQAAAAVIVLESASSDGETLDGIPVVVGFSRSKISGWTVGIGIARAELMAPLYSSLRLTILAGAALLLLALVIAWLISSRWKATCARLTALKLLNFPS